MYARKCDKLENYNFNIVNDLNYQKNRNIIKPNTFIDNLIEKRIIESEVADSPGAATWFGAPHASEQLLIVSRVSPPPPYEQAIDCAWMSARKS